jgi:FixJ family two-component response regulator
MSDQGCLICVVDDDCSVRRALARLLRSEGYEAETFGDAEAFLAFDMRQRAVCLVLDVKLPGTSGIMLLRQLREAGSTVPAICISAMYSEEIRTETLEAGAHAFFNKPFNATDLLGAINQALGSRSATRASKEAGTAEE